MVLFSVSHERHSFLSSRFGYTRFLRREGEKNPSLNKRELRRNGCFPVCRGRFFSLGGVIYVILLIGFVGIDCCGFAGIIPVAEEGLGYEGVVLGASAGVGVFVDGGSGAGGLLDFGVDSDGGEDLIAVGVVQGFQDFLAHIGSSVVESWNNTGDLDGFFEVFLDHVEIVDNLCGSEHGQVVHRNGDDQVLGVEQSILVQDRQGRGAVCEDEVVAIQIAHSEFEDFFSSGHGNQLHFTGGEGVVGDDAVDDAAAIAFPCVDNAILEQHVADDEVIHGVFGFAEAEGFFDISLGVAVQDEDAPVFVESEICGDGDDGGGFSGSAFKVLECDDPHDSCSPGKMSRFL